MADGEVVVWEIDGMTGRVVAQFQDPSGLADAVKVLVEMPPGGVLVGDHSGTLLLWNYHSQQVIQRFNMHSQPITSIIFYNNNKNIAVGSEDKLLSLWQIKNNNEIFCNKILKTEGEVYCLGEMGSQKKLVISDSKNRARVLDWDSYCFQEESQALINGESIQHILQTDFLTEQAVYPLLLCFTRKGLILMDGDTLEGLQYFDELGNNLLLSTGHVKALFQSAAVTGPSLSFYLLNQNTTDTPVTRYSLNF